MAKNYRLSTESSKPSKMLLDSVSAPGSKSGVPPKAQNMERPDYTSPSQKPRKNKDR